MTLKSIILTLSIITASSAKCQLSEIKYDVETNDTLSVKHYATERAEWQVEDNSITWVWYDVDSNLLLNNSYTVISKEISEMGFDYLYLVQDENGAKFIIEFWILADKTKSVSYRYSDGVVYYSGNVSF